MSEQGTLDLAVDERPGPRDVRQVRRELEHADWKRMHRCPACHEECAQLCNCSTCQVCTGEAECKWALRIVELYEDLELLEGA